jgi:hypothetical protein
MDTPATAKRTGPKDVALHLFAIVLLYGIVIHVGILLFQLINQSFVDPLSVSYGYSYASRFRFGPLRWAIATLVIAFPIFTWVTTMIERDCTRNPEKRQLRTRRWLLYLTLFAAGLTIVGDLSTLVFQFLNGEITTRFILKVLAILAIAAGVFGYYLGVLRRDTGAPVGRWHMILARAIPVLVAAALVWGFVVSGTPQSERLRRFDARRVTDLSNIQRQIVSHWQQRGALPEKLDALADSISGYKAPLDPQDATPYRYRIVGERQFELCAVFRADNRDDTKYTGLKPYYDTDFRTWDHGKGITCFTRTIDPARYPSRQPKLVPIDQPMIYD